MNKLNMNHAAIPFRLSFPYKGGTYLFTPEQIVRLKAESNYTKIFFLNHKPIVMAKVLSDYAHILEPFGFIRTHRSHLVNRQHILQIDTSSTVTMADNSKAEISRRRKREIIDSIANPFHAA